MSDNTLKISPSFRPLSTPANDNILQERFNRIYSIYKSQLFALIGHQRYMSISADVIEQEYNTMRHLFKQYDKPEHRENHFVYSIEHENFTVNFWFHKEKVSDPVTDIINKF